VETTGLLLFSESEATGKDGIPEEAEDSFSPQEVKASKERRRRDREYILFIRRLLS
jgi:hypothetical protein